MIIVRNLVRRYIPHQRICSSEAGDHLSVGVENGVEVIIVVGVKYPRIKV